jgi:hypothetical protein
MKRVGMGVFALALFASLLGIAPREAGAAWRSLKPADSAGDVCLAVKGESFDYALLDPAKPAVFDVRGPRKIKIASRYLFGPGDADTGVYTLRVLMDGEEILRRSYSSAVLAGAARCSGGGEAAALRSTTLRVPTGKHQIQVYAEVEGEGRTAARFYREVKRAKVKDVAFAPEQYAAVAKLQFASGSTSTYYHFHADSPLAFTVTGPTTLKVYTRLDFDHRMNGAQSYALELLRDGVSVNTYHYHADTLDSAVYVGKPQVLPGERKLLRIPVPRGRHRYELRCVRPEACGIAAQILIPEADVSMR